MGKATDEWTYGDVEAGFKSAALVLDETFVTPNTSHQPLETAHGDGVLAERQAVPALLDAEHRADGRVGRALGRHRRRQDVVLISEYTGGGFGSKITGRDLDGDSGAAVEEGERAGDDAHQPRGRALHRPRAARRCTRA